MIKSKKRYLGRSDLNLVPLTIRIQKEMHDRIKNVSRKQLISLNMWLNQAIAKALKGEVS